MDATKRRHQADAKPTCRKVVEEPFLPAPPAAAAATAPPSHLVGAIVEKGFSAAAPSSAPRPTVLPFPVARHRSHGPHWNAATKDAKEEEEDDEMDMDETDYQPVAAVADPVRRKERKGMDFSQWRELVSNDAPLRPKRKQAKPSPLKKQTTKIDARDEASKAPKVGVVVGERELGGDGMQLDSRNSREWLVDATSVSDTVVKKPMEEVDVMDDVPKVGGVGDVELRGEGMQVDGGKASVAAEIDAENMTRLAGMSAGDIVEAQAEILERMNPAVVEMLKRRGKEKSGGGKGGGRDKSGQNTGSRKAARAMPRDWLTAGEHSGHSWKSWSERVELIRLCRFSLDGDILGFQSSQEQQDGICIV